MEKLPWVTEYEKLQAFREEVRRLVKKADDELSTGLVLLPLQDLHAGLKVALGDELVESRYVDSDDSIKDDGPTFKTVRYKKTYRDGCSGLEECGADPGRVLD